MLGRELCVQRLRVEGGLARVKKSRAWGILAICNWRRPKGTKQGGGTGDGEVLKIGIKNIILPKLKHSKTSLKKVANIIPTAQICSAKTSKRYYLRLFDLGRKRCNSHFKKNQTM